MWSVKYSSGEIFCSVCPHYPSLSVCLALPLLSHFLPFSPLTLLSSSLCPLSLSQSLSVSFYLPRCCRELLSIKPVTGFTKTEGRTETKGDAVESKERVKEHLSFFFFFLVYRWLLFSKEWSKIASKPWCNWEKSSQHNSLYSPQTKSIKGNVKC